jgi:TolB-like protein/Tfp pilus assembly protein PilF
VCPSKHAGLSPGLIRAHLAEVLASAAFSKADRISRFLRYVVEESLEGRGSQISEYSIGVEIYDRPRTFDTRLDSIVRVEAGRLRSKLREYYDGEGASSSIRMDLPKGGYLPVFRERQAPSSTLPALDQSSLRGSRAIAVLPFADLSPQRDQEYLGDGIAEELMFALSRLRDVRVSSQTSVFAFKGKQQDIRTIGELLNVDAIVEGSVRKAGLRLRISAQMIDIASGFRIWSNVYDRELIDVFGIQEDIARSIVTALADTLLTPTAGGLAHPSTANVAAHTAYLRGRFFWNRQREDSLRLAIGEFERAISEDSSFARAHIGVSDCYRLLEFWGVMAPEAAITKARDAVANALALDSSLPEAHAARAALDAVYEWKWALAEQQFRHVFAVLPNYAVAHQAYATMCLVPQARFEEAIGELMIAKELDPLALWLNAQLGFVYFLNRQDEQATAQLKRTLELDDCFPLAHTFLAAVYSQQGRLEQALTALQQARKHAGEGSRVLGWLAYVNARLGRTKKASQILEELETASQSRYVCPLDLARGYLGIGDSELTLTHLERAADRRCGRLVSAVVDPSYDVVHSEQRFTVLRSRMHLQ